MSILKLQDRQTQLILSRSQGKDIVEQAERELAAVAFAIAQINEVAKEAQSAEEIARKGAEAEAAADCEVTDDPIAD